MPDFRDVLTDPVFEQALEFVTDILRSSVLSIFPVRVQGLEVKGELPLTGIVTGEVIDLLVEIIVEPIGEPKNVLGFADLRSQVAFVNNRDSLASTPAFCHPECVGTHNPDRREVDPQG